MKTIFTTGQVAKICKVAPRTVSKWFDAGRLGGYRIPGSQDRRIPRENLIRFLQKYGMPLGELEDMSNKILCVSSNRGKFQGVFDGEFNVVYAMSGFQAGVAFESCHAQCVLVDFDTLRDEALQLVRSLRSMPNNIPSVIIGVGNPQVDHTGCTVFFCEPFDRAVLLMEVQRLLNARVTE